MLEKEIRMEIQKEKKAFIENSMRRNLETRDTLMGQVCEADVYTKDVRKNTLE